MYEMQGLNQRVTADKSDLISNHGFIFLLHSIGERLNCDLEKLRIVDSIVKEILECIQSVDEAIDTEKREQKIDQIMLGYTKIVSSLSRIYSSFGGKKFIKVSKMINEYFNEMRQAFLKESSILANINLGIYPTNEQLIEMQKLRNLDLFIYFDIYSELLPLPSKLRLYIKKYLIYFGLIDVAIDDIVDLQEDYSVGNYNIFLIKLSEKMNSRGYPKMLPSEVLFYVKKMKAMQEVYSMLLPFRKSTLNMKSGPDAIRKYFISIIKKRYYAFRKQF